MIKVHTILDWGNFTTTLNTSPTQTLHTMIRMETYIGLSMEMKEYQIREIRYEFAFSINAENRKL